MKLTGLAAAQPSLLATRRGKLILVLLCSVAFLDFVDTTIVNVALPSMRLGLHMSVQNLQWIPSAYLLTYGGFMLLGGRAADLLGRRRVLVAGTSLFGLASIIGGLAGSPGRPIGGARRPQALGAWGGVAGLASAFGVLLGGVLTQGPGWRWVFFVNPPICLLVLGAAFWLLSGERRHAQLASFDLRGAVLSTGGMLLLVYAIVRAPDVGWGAARTIAELTAAVALLAVFAINELRRANALLPLSIFRINGLAAADVTQVIATAGFISMFFFLTLYMQNVLHYSPIQTGLAYLPVTAGVAITAGITSKLLARTGTRSVIVAGALIAASGVYYLSRIPVHGSYLTDLFPGLVVMSIGLGALLVAVTTGANAGVPAEKAGLAAALLNASQQLGGALGLAIFAAIATSHTSHLLAAHTAMPAALTAGFQRALLASCVSLVAAAVIATRTSHTRGEPDQDVLVLQPQPEIQASVAA